MITKTEISIIIPVYNRAWCVQRAIDSAVQFIGKENDAEIVLVDDGSTDDSIAVIKKAIDDQFASSLIRFYFHEKNQGVCAAKNAGAHLASGDWLVFFDSDDELMPDGMFYLKQCLETTDSIPLHFFTAIDEYSSFDIERGDIPNTIDFLSYLTKGAGGEALPVVKREAFLRFQYDEDIRGYEGLAYMRMVKQYGLMVIHTIGLRRYYTSHYDRLSSRSNMRKRRNDLYKGHLRALCEHYKDAPLLWSIKQLARAAYALLR